MFVVSSNLLSLHLSSFQIDIFLHTQHNFCSMVQFVFPYVSVYLASNCRLTEEQWIHGLTELLSRHLPAGLRESARSMVCGLPRFRNPWIYVVR
jgi:hypothetical protein